MSFYTVQSALCARAIPAQHGVIIIGIATVQRAETLSHVTFASPVGTSHRLLRRTGVRAVLRVVGTRPVVTGNTVYTLAYHYINIYTEKEKG